VASPNIYSTGIGGSTGSALVTASPLFASGSIWYVSSSTGSDAASPRGKERIRPLATLSQAHTNATAGDIIVCLSGHSETLTSGITFNKAGITVIGEGTGSSRPKFTRNFDGVMFDVTAAGVTFESVYFVASGTASTSARLRTAGARGVVSTCYFEHGTNDTGPGLELITGADEFGIDNTTFISTSTSVSSQPESALKVTNAVSDLHMSTVTFDGGSSGWSNPYALNGAGAITRIKALNVDLLKDSDVTFATGTTGYFVTREKSGSARIVWAA